MEPTIAYTATLHDLALTLADALLWHLTSADLVTPRADGPAALAWRDNVATLRDRLFALAPPLIPGSGPSEPPPGSVASVTGFAAAQQHWNVRIGELAGYIAAAHQLGLHVRIRPHFVGANGDVSYAIELGTAGPQPVDDEDF